MEPEYAAEHSRGGDREEVISDETREKIMTVQHGSNDRLCGRIWLYFTTITDGVNDLYPCIHLGSVLLDDMLKFLWRPQSE